MKTFAARVVRATQFGLWSQPKTVPIGPALYGNPLDGTFQMIARGAYGDYVFEALKQAPKDCVFLDIGANIGTFSVALAEHFEQRVYSFEPNPVTFGYLQQNLAHAGLDEVFAVCAGVVAQDAKSLQLNTRRFHSGAASVARSFGWRAVRISLVGPTLMKAIVAQNRPIVVKLDVEGAELEVVKCLDASGLLARCERIVVEMSSGTNNAGALDEIRSMLTANGLKFESRHGTDHFGDELFIRG